VVLTITLRHSKIKKVLIIIREFFFKLLIEKFGENGINSLVKVKVDDLIRLGLTNYEILEELDENNIPETIIPTHKQISNRRFYYKNKILYDLKDHSKGSYDKWVNEHKGSLSNCGDHDFIILSSNLKEQDFMLLVTTKALLSNSKAQAEETQASYVAIDATHKLISCGFKFSTIATCTMQQEIADIAYLIHAHEDYKSYNYAIDEISEALKTHLDFIWQPQVKIYFIFLYFYSLQCLTFLRS